MRKEKIQYMIDSFIKVFSESGLDGTSMVKLAKGADMTESLIYRYFENKDDIIKQCTVYYHVYIQKGLTDIMIKNINDEQELVNSLLEYIDSVIDICRFLLQVMAHPTYCSIMDTTNITIEKDIMRFSLELQKKYNLDTNTARGISTILNSIINDYI